MVDLLDSKMVQQPKSISVVLNDMSELVTTAVTVNGTGAVWEEDKDNYYFSKSCKNQGH